MASDVFPDPDTPTTATIRHSGTSTSISRRLLCRAPRTPMTAGSVPGTGSSPVTTPGTLGRPSGDPPAGGRGSGSGQARTGAGVAGPGALSSGVDRAGRALVEAQRLHDLEGRGVGEGLDVGGGQHAGVLGDHGRDGTLGDGIEVALHTQPEVLPGRHVVRHRVDARQGLPGAGLDVRDVLLVHRDVVAGGEPGEVPQRKCVHGQDSAMAGPAKYPSTPSDSLTFQIATQPPLTTPPH